MPLSEILMVLDALVARRGYLLYTFLNHADPDCVRDGVPSCPCTPPSDWSVEIDEGQVALGVDILPFRAPDGQHGFRLRSFVVQADVLPRVELDDDARERIARVLAEVLG